MWFIFRSLRTINEMAKYCNRPWKLGLYLWHHIWYKSDQAKHGIPDHWQTAEQTLIDRNGDCDDFAVLAKAVLEKQGKKPIIMSAYNGKDGHAECVFYYKGKWRSIANQGYRTYGRQFDDVPRKLIKDSTRYRLHEDNGTIIEGYVLVGDIWRKVE